MQAFKRISVLILISFMLLAIGCATIPAEKPMTAKQQAVIWMNIYSAQYDDAMAVMKNPQSTQAQKDVAQKKKVVLTKIWPLLKVFAATVDSGVAPSANDTAQIADLINQLIALSGGV